jgi:iron(II)-dependent oxidoreductase
MGDASDPNRANYNDTNIATTNAVGCFPGGASPYGVEDMSGNIWEWTRSLWGNYPYPSDAQERLRREGLQASDDQFRVLRGGAFGSVRWDVRCAVRDWFHPVNSVANLGFRVVGRPSF